MANITNKTASKDYGFDGLSNYQLCLGEAYEYTTDDNQREWLICGFDSKDKVIQRSTLKVAKYIIDVAKREGRYE